MIDTQESLDGLAERMARATRIGVDTEADSLHNYPEKLCLLQMSFGGADYLVDTLAPLDFGVLLTRLKGAELILHGADYDLRMMFRTWGFVPERVFDTMWAARLLGASAFGLADLVKQYLGIVLTKGAQKADWSRRPLTPVMEEYARNDSRHLEDLADRLAAELKSSGRLSWAKECFDRAIFEAVEELESDPENEWRLKGADRLDRRGQAVLRELFYWREGTAVALGRPPFFVLSHDRMLDLAEGAAAGKGVGHLVPARMPTPRRQALREAIEKGLDLPESQWPHPRVRVRRFLSDRQKRRMEELREIRDRKAAEFGIDPTLIASKAALIQLAADWVENSKVLMTWQRDALER